MERAKFHQQWKFFNVTNVMYNRHGSSLINDSLSWSDHLLSAQTMLV